MRAAPPKPITPACAIKLREVTSKKLTASTRYASSVIVTCKVPEANGLTTRVTSEAITSAMPMAIADVVHGRTFTTRRMIAATMLAAANNVPARIRSVFAEKSGISPASKSVYWRNTPPGNRGMRPGALCLEAFEDDIFVFGQIDDHGGLNSGEEPIVDVLSDDGEGGFERICRKHRAKQGCKVGPHKPEDRVLLNDLVSDDLTDRVVGTGQGERFEG